VFLYDNEPDDASDGLFRIIKNMKIGYADATTGKVIIVPQFECAFPFENGRAKVSYNCTSKSYREHYAWISDNWFYIDKKGKKINRQNSKEYNLISKLLVTT
jgi:hypothetical protein